MDAWIVWLLIGVALGVGEVLTLSLFLGPFAVGGLAASAAAGLDAGLAVQVLVFAAVTVALLGLVRPVAVRHLRQPSSTRTGAQALVGRTAVVTRALDGPELAGQVRLDGEVWTARSAGQDPVAEGETVTVLEIRGATAVVVD
jgi:membrane protein implicated in regulation of membrane protease activity